jgi:hypothetical protein
LDSISISVGSGHIGNRGRGSLFCPYRRFFGRPYSLFDLPHQASRRTFCNHRLNKGKNMKLFAFFVIIHKLPIVL